jgi:hypothetical protein
VAGPPADLRAPASWRRDVRRSAWLTDCLKIQSLEIGKTASESEDEDRTEKTKIKSFKSKIALIMIIFAFY